MINGLEGIPGSGKSYEAVAFHVLPALQAGRKVITNLPLDVQAFASIDPGYPALIEVRTAPAPRRGNWDASNIAKDPAFQLWSAERSPDPAPESVSVFGWVWDYYSDWRDEGGRGPLYIIDECHVPLPSVGTSKEVIEWYKLHRHFNADVLLMTQSFRDSNQPIARLIASLIKCRKADILGKANHYIRKVHGGYRGAVIQVDKRPYKREYFSLYRSHTQGLGIAEAKAQDVSPFIVKFNRIKWVIVALGVVAMTWAFWPKPGRNVFGVRTSSPVASVAAAALPASVPVAVSALPASSPPVAPPPPKVVEPYEGKGVHLVGVLESGSRQLTIFTVSANGQRLFDLTGDEILAAGYRWDHVNYCFGWLDYQGIRRPVICDAPVLNTGHADRPVVLDASNGRRSDQSVPFFTPQSSAASVLDVSPRSRPGFLARPSVRGA